MTQITEDCNNITNFAVSDGSARACLLDQWFSIYVLRKNEFKFFYFLLKLQTKRMFGNILCLYNFAPLNIAVSHLRIFISILKNAIFSNIRQELDKKHWPKVIVQNYCGHFLRYCISQYQKLLLLHLSLLTVLVLGFSSRCTTGGRAASAHDFKLLNLLLQLT